MINGRVERCADNIMRRIVPVRDPRGPRHLERERERGAFWRPRKEISPEKNVFLPPFSGNSSFLEENFVIFRNVTRLLLRKAESIFDLALNLINRIVTRGFRREIFFLLLLLSCPLELYRVVRVNECEMHCDN